MCFQSVIDFLRYLLIDPDGNVTPEIATFCSHVDRNLSYPDPVKNYWGFCERGVLDQFLAETKVFYFSYINADSKQDICRYTGYNYYTVHNYMLRGRP